jgi:hypothetical protein
VWTRISDFRGEELEEPSIKWGNVEEAFEEGQGPQKAVEPIMRMN